MPKKTVKTSSGRARSGGRTKGRRTASPGPILITSASLVALALGLTLVLCLVQSPAQRSPKAIATGQQAQGGSPKGSAAGQGTSADVTETVPFAAADGAAKSSQGPTPIPLAPRAAGTADGTATGTAAGTATSAGGRTVTVMPEARPAPERDMGGLVAAGEALSLKASSRARSSAGSGRFPVPRPATKGPRLIFVIDDVGYNLAQLKPFLDLPFPITFAVLPGLPHSAEAARMIRAAGKELILHQPMESVGGANPGPNAIYLSTSPSEAAAIVRRNLDSLPGAVGMNNHEGSAVTQNEALMEAIMAVAKSRGIYYLDSLTITDTATEGIALREKIRYWERDVFLDNSPDPVSIVQYVEVGKKKAEKNGAAVMIGHVWSAELAQTLSDLYPSLIEGGFSLSTISKVMLEEADASTGD